MNNWGKNKIDPTDNISAEKWINHFETLLNDKKAAQPEVVVFIYGFSFLEKKHVKLAWHKN